MSLNVLTDFSQLSGKTMTAYSFSYGNEEIVYMMDKDGNETRYRIPATIRDLLIDFAAIETCQEGY